MSSSKAAPVCGTDVCIQSSQFDDHPGIWSTSSWHCDDDHVIMLIIMPLWWLSWHCDYYPGTMMIIMVLWWSSWYGICWSSHKERMMRFSSPSLLWLLKLQNLSSRQHHIVIDMLSLCSLLIPKRSADTQHPLIPFSLLNAFSKLNLHLWIVCQISFSYKKESCHYAVCEPMQCLVTDTFIQEMLNVHSQDMHYVIWKSFFSKLLLSFKKGL